MNLVLIERDEISAGGEVTLSGARAAHLLNVLRIEPGDGVRVGVVDGPRGVGTVGAIEDGGVRLSCVFEAATPPRPNVDLLLAVPRPKVMRRLWAQIAALGVGQIILTNAEKVERNYFDTHILSPATYRPLLIEGLQQARDTRLPIVSVHRQFKILIEDHLERLCSERASAWSPIRRQRHRSPTSHGRSGINGCCWRSDRRAAGTTSSLDCSTRTVFSASEWDRARCERTPPALRCSLSLTARSEIQISDFRFQIDFRLV